MAEQPNATPSFPSSATPIVPSVKETTLQPVSDLAGDKEASVKNNQGPDAGNATPQSAPTGETTSKRTGIVVHHLNDSRSQRILWLLEELELPYEIKKYQRDELMRAPKDLKGVHALGKSPVLTDGDVVLAESGAITEYIISKFGQKFGPIESGIVDNIYFTHFAEGSIMPLLVNRLIFTIIPQRSPALIRPLIKPIFSTLIKKQLDPELRTHCALIESHLARSETGWFAGGDHPTSADFMMSFPLEILALHIPFCGPKVKEYVERMHQRSAYKRGLEQGGKFNYAKL